MSLSEHLEGSGAMATKMEMERAEEKRRKYTMHAQDYHQNECGGLDFRLYNLKGSAIVLMSPEQLLSQPSEARRQLNLAMDHKR